MQWLPHETWWGYSPLNKQVMAIVNFMSYEFWSSHQRDTQRIAENCTSERQKSSHVTDDDIIAEVL